MDAKIKQPASAASILAFPVPRPRAAASIGAETDQQLLLDTVLNNMSQGVLMFDAEARLVFCNQRYIEMYGLSAEVATPGCALRDLLDAPQGGRRASPEARRTTSSTCSRRSPPGKPSNGIVQVGRRPRVLDRAQSDPGRRLDRHP